MEDIVQKHIETKDSGQKGYDEKTDTADHRPESMTNKPSSSEIECQMTELESHIEALARRLSALMCHTDTGETEGDAKEPKSSHSGHYNRLKKMNESVETIIQRLEV